MAIGTDSVVLFFGTQDQVDDGTTSTISNNAFSVAADISAWTNDDDAPLAGAVLECQFDTTMPTVGSIGLYARLLNVQSTNDVGVPDANHESLFLGSFPIDFGVSPDVNFFSVIPMFQIPALITSQQIEFYLKNEATAQTIGIDWNLWITPLTHGPHA